MVTLLTSLLVIFTASCEGTRSEISYAITYDDVCTNECDDSDPSYWCGLKRKDQNGKISQCVQYSQTGDACVSSCQDQKGEKYKWCRTNAVEVDTDWWDYCSLKGFTVNQEKCFDECSMRDENYYWCRTNTKDKWDYCSPDARVKPLQLTRLGGRCKSQCELHKDDYYWCTRNKEVCNDDSCDEYWEYCSIDEKQTYKGKECTSECMFHSATVGVDYYWCNTQDDDWEYCSPTARDGVHLSLKPQFDIRGKECITLCSKNGEKYFWCKMMGGYDYWDYCSPDNRTLYNAACSDPCRRRGESYFWCHTGSSWDYCSPDAETVRSGGSGMYELFGGKYELFGGKYELFGGKCAHFGVIVFVLSWFNISGAFI